MKAPWRPLFISTIILSTGLSLSQLILIYQVNQRWGIPNLVFALGDDLISVICGQFISMPIWVMVLTHLPLLTMHGPCHPVPCHLGSRGSELGCSRARTAAKRLTDWRPRIVNAHSCTHYVATLYGWARSSPKAWKRPCLPW